MGTKPTGPRTAVGRWVLALLERRPLVGGLLVAVVGVGLATYAVAWEGGAGWIDGTEPGGTGGFPGGMVVSFAGGAGLVLAFVGLRSMVLAYRHRRRPG
jgi:hypothetical protein